MPISKRGIEMKTFNSIVKEQFNRRAVKDRRKRVNWIVVSYLDPNGIEYRKSYEFPVKMTFDDMIKSIPKSIE